VRQIVNRSDTVSIQWFVVIVVPFITHDTPTPEKFFNLSECRQTFSALRDHEFRKNLLAKPRCCISDDGHRKASLTVSETNNPAGNL
jgi:hypothetical protein